MTSEADRGKQKLTVKDLITVGVFSAIILICISLSGGPLAMFPALTSYFPVGTILLAEPVYLLLAAKVPKPESIFIAGLMMAVLCYMTGMYADISIDYLAGSALADLVARVGRYRSIKTNILSCIVFYLDGTGSYLVYFINPQAWVSRMSGKGIPQGYLGTMAATINHWTLISMLADTVLVALFSGFVGSRLLKKRLEKARITA